MTEPLDGAAYGGGHPRQCLTAGDGRAPACDRPSWAETDSIVAHAW